MYLRSFSLREEPFGVTPDPRFLYLGPSHREVLASLLHAIDCGRGFMALIAEPGLGKTTLLTELLERVRGYARSVSVFQTQCTRIELLRYILTDCGLKAQADDLVSMHEQLNSMLISNDRCGKRFIIVIDEAQNLSEEVLESIRLLSDFETPQRKLLQIVLAGQPQFGVTLSRPGLRQLRQRMSMICQLKPLTHGEVQEYIRTRLRIAGTDLPLFTPSAMDSIARLSKGIPRVVNNYCFNLLSLAYAMERSIVDEQMVDEVALDLVVDPTATGATETTRGSAAPTNPLSSPSRGRSSVSCPSSRRRSTAINSSETIDVPFGSSALRAAAKNAVEVSRKPCQVTSISPAAAFPGPSVPESRNPKVSVETRAADTSVDPRTPLAAVDILRHDAEQFYAARVDSQNDKQKHTITRKRLVAWTAITLTIWGGAFLLARRIPFDSGSSELRDLNMVQRSSGRVQPGVVEWQPSSLQENHKSTVQLPKKGKSSGVQKSSVALFVPTGSIPTVKIEETEPVDVLPGGLQPMFPFLPDRFNMPSLAEQPRTQLVPGRLIRKVLPIYPASAKSTSAEVELTATVNEAGEVEEVAVDRGIGIFSQAAVRAVRDWRYTPFTVNGKPVRAITHVSVKFTPARQDTER